jgi:hypothetical protein
LKPDASKVNGTHYVLVYSNSVNILGLKFPTVVERAKTLVVASNVFGLDLKADNTYYMVTSDQNERGSFGIKVQNN